MGDYLKDYINERLILIFILTLIFNQKGIPHNKMAFSGSNLVRSIKDNKDILMITGLGFIVAMVLYVIIGIFAGLVADGAIAVPTAVNTTIQGFATTAGTVFTTILGVFGTIAGFVVIVALLSAFGISLDFGGKREGNL